MEEVASSVGKLQKGENCVIGRWGCKTINKQVVELIKLRTASFKS